MDGFNVNYNLNGNKQTSSVLTKELKVHRFNEVSIFVLLDSLFTG